jgi:pyrrolidone-carboxylate peptidase
VLYESLLLCAANGNTAAAGFIHIPATLARRVTGRPTGAEESTLDWENALAGGLEIVRVCLGRPAPVRRKPLSRAR